MFFRPFRLFPLISDCSLTVFPCDNSRLDRDRALINQQMNQTMGQRVKDRALAAVARGDLQGGKFSSTTVQQSEQKSGEW